MWLNAIKVKIKRINAQDIQKSVRDCHGQGKGIANSLYVDVRNGKNL